MIDNLDKIPKQLSGIMILKLCCFYFYYGLEAMYQTKILNFILERFDKFEEEEES